MPRNTVRQPPPNNASIRQGELADPSLPKKEPNTGISLESVVFHGETYKDASGSSGTVVQTPHVESRANMSSAALELFENGISFDNLEQPDSNRRQSRLISPPELPRIHPTDNEDIKRTSRLAHQVESTGLPAVNVTTPDNDTITLDSNQVKRNSYFLGRQARSKLEPGEIREDPIGRPTTSSTSLPSLSALIKPSSLNHNFNLESSKGKAESFPLENTSQHKRFTHESATTRPRFDAVQALPGFNARHFLHTTSPSEAVARSPVFQRNQMSGG